MKKNKKKHVALVTGGGSGIGFAIAQTFVRNNMLTVIIGRNEEKLAAAQKELGELCIAIPADLTDFDSIPALIEKIVAEHGLITTLVNNAGMNHKKDFVDVTDEEFKKVLDINVNAAFTISREVVKHMLPYKHGNIINISSMASQYGIPKVIAYTASKAAIEGMTKAMAVELSPKGIRVNCVAPGFIATDMSAKALNNDAERRQKVFSRTPMGKMGEPADIGEAVYFLASEAAKYITGVVLPVDGGNSIGF
jgi:NAD(P)-dependent dehydrogenase (short-subunit alcohol dehydrogenase family)